ncbi:hypothetical protein BBJ28_00018554 [Nothophytophthora sp. Chile5]|nr:hypothetical protein BBJ28_00018554 [Nothophytophthora sp. Chile5]
MAPPPKRSAGSLDASARAPKRIQAPHVQRRGDGFTEFEATGLLQLVRVRWRDGWDMLTQLHNQQHPGHNRSAESLKKKYSRLYRAKLPPRGAKNHAVVALAHTVHKEMLEGSIPEASEGGEDEGEENDEVTVFLPPQAEERSHDGVTEAETHWLEAVPPPPPAVAARPRVPRHNVEWQTAAPAAAAPPAEELLASVLKAILHSQHQRDLDREEERTRREEEREHRKEKAEQRRQEEERRRADEREERRRRGEERAEERAESRRQHDQFMQTMLVLMAKVVPGQQQDRQH